MKLLLQQDECAPDSLDYFEEKFKEITGEEFMTFRKSSRYYTPDNGYTSYYLKDKYQLSVSADDPYWKLEESTPP